MDLNKLSKVQKKVYHSMKQYFDDIDKWIDIDALDIAECGKDSLSQYVKDFQLYVEIAISSINEKFKQLDKSRYTNGILIM